MRKRKIVKVGSSIDIRLKPQDLEELGWKVGDYVDIEDVSKLKKGREEKK